MKECLELRKLAGPGVSRSVPGSPVFSGAALAAKKTLRPVFQRRLARLRPRFRRRHKLQAPLFLRHAPAPARRPPQTAAARPRAPRPMRRRTKAAAAPACCEVTAVVFVYAVERVCRAWRGSRWTDAKRTRMQSTKKWAHETFVPLLQHIFSASPSRGASPLSPLADRSLRSPRSLWSVRRGKRARRRAAIAVPAAKGVFSPGRKKRGQWCVVLRVSGRYRAHVIAEHRLVGPMPRKAAFQRPQRPRRHAGGATLFFVGAHPRLAAPLFPLSPPSDAR